MRTFVTALLMVAAMAIKIDNSATTTAARAANSDQDASTPAARAANSDQDAQKDFENVGAQCIKEAKCTYEDNKCILKNSDSITKCMKGKVSKNNWSHVEGEIKQYLASLKMGFNLHTFQRLYEKAGEKCHKDIMGPCGKDKDRAGQTPGQCFLANKNRFIECVVKEMPENYQAYAKKDLTEKFAHMEKQRNAHAKRKNDTDATDAKKKKGTDATDAKKKNDSKKKTARKLTRAERRAKWCIKHPKACDVRKAAKQARKARHVEFKEKLRASRNVHQTKQIEQADEKCSKDEACQAGIAEGIKKYTRYAAVQYYRRKCFRSRSATCRAEMKAAKKARARAWSKQRSGLIKEWRGNEKTHRSAFIKKFRAARKADKKAAKKVAP